MQGLGHRIGFWDSLVLNAYGDAACALTPLRIGGEPARLAGMLQSRVPATAAFVAISLEVLAAWPVILFAAGWMAWHYAPDWWATAGPRLASAAAGRLAVGAAGERGERESCGGMRAGWRRPRSATSRRPVRRALVYWRRMPMWPLVASLPLSFLNLATRTAILPVLALTLPSPPELGPMLLGSFALLYSQLILPTPSGAGAVELGFLGGAAGDLGARSGWLLLAWRFYTNGVGVLLGVGLAAHAYGWPALRRLARRWSDPD